MFTLDKFPFTSFVQKLSKEISQLQRLRFSIFWGASDGFDARRTLLMLMLAGAGAGADDPGAMMITLWLLTAVCTSKATTPHPTSRDVSRHSSVHVLFQPLDGNQLP
eukprot:6482913-Amphidinium_carterae.1